MLEQCEGQSKKVIKVFTLQGHPEYSTPAGNESMTLQSKQMDAEKREKFLKSAEETQITDVAAVARMMRQVLFHQNGM